ncbi:hypothetical protein E6C27_scaffold81G001230 [Cucumis melo var. makuwa]|uniref:Uncharacterized protein n=1 Tax=Cucumis melo var. makuwa TaxID=1194695 RepID=A0A5A7SR47_CUCMM|nr:hypothetical protein E6C27_scaffold81G001230 [Cucumis melo var. makuwa]
MYVALKNKSATLIRKAFRTSPSTTAFNDGHEWNKNFYAKIKELHQQQEEPKSEPQQGMPLGRDATTATWGGRAANGVLPLVDPFPRILVIIPPRFPSSHNCVGPRPLASWKTPFLLSRSLPKIEFHKQVLSFVCNKKLEAGFIGKKVAPNRNEQALRGHPYPFLGMTEVWRCAEWRLRSGTKPSSVRLRRRERVKEKRLPPVTCLPLPLLTDSLIRRLLRSGQLVWNALGGHPCLSFFPTTDSEVASLRKRKKEKPLLLLLLRSLRSGTTTD